MAYVTDGRNIYRYERHSSDPSACWECILSQGGRLELAAGHDLREPRPVLSNKPAESKAE